MKKNTLFLSLLLAWVFMISPISANATENTEPLKDGVARYVSVELLPTQSHIRQGESAKFILKQTITPEWHTYWVNPGDSGEATRIKWNLPEGFEGGTLQFPIPERIPFGPLLNLGYNNEALFLTEITAPPVIDGESVTLKANVEWLVCKDICIPETSEVSLTMPVAKAGQAIQPANTEMLKAAEAQMPIKGAITGSFEEGDGSLTLNFSALNVDLTNVQSAEFSPLEWGIILYPNAQEFKKTSAQNFSILMSRDNRSLSEIKSIDGVVVLNSSDGARKGYEVSIPLPHSAAMTTQENAQKKTENLNGALNTQSGSASLGLITALFFALLGGLILNLMPCVFPILSMKALSLVKLSDKEQKHAVLNGAAYTFGILLCFLAIAGALILLQQAGAQIGWGFQLQNPAIVLALTFLLFVMGLNLSGFFEFKNIFGNVGQNLTQKDGLTGSFFTGVLATIVATPCTAPFMGAAMGFALTQPPSIALLVFLSLGLGLALPYLLLCIFPTLRKFLPKAGAWMVTFKEFLAFPLYASAAWLFWVFAQQVQDVTIEFLALLGLVGIALSIWLFQKTQKLFFKILAILIALLSLLYPLTHFNMQQKQNGVTVETAQSENLHGNHIPFTAAKFDEALKGDAPLFVNMTASWCITCKINERVALLNKDVQKTFEQQGVQYFVGDWTNQNAEITEYLAKFGRNGVPIYVYYPPRGEDGTRKDPILLPQLLTPTLIIETVTLK